MMKLNYRSIWFLLVLIAIIGNGCNDAFIPDLPSSNKNNLVVEGMINTGAGETKITLSRVTSLSSLLTLTNVPELNAKVQVEGADNSVKLLTEQGNGVYAATLTGMAANGQYRLRITTSSNKVYLSDFTNALVTPAVDDLSWKREASGVQIGVKTKAPQTASKYYKWEYDEIYEYTSVAVSDYKYIKAEKRVAQRTANEQIYRCYRSKHSPDILLGSTAALTENTISNFPIRLIPNNSQLLTVKYYIALKQYSINADANRFFTQMKKNTELTGSIFDQQPSEAQGNIHNLNDVSEIVIGYITASTVEEKKIFITNSQVPGWSYAYPSQCSITILVNNTIPDFEQYFTTSYVPLVPVLSATNTILGYTSYYSECLDCTAAGGTTTKPSFW